MQNVLVFMSNDNVINVGNVMEAFFENLPDMDDNRSVTNRLIKTMNHVARGCSF